MGGGGVLPVLQADFAEEKDAEPGAGPGAGGAGLGGAGAVAAGGDDHRRPHRPGRRPAVVVGGRSPAAAAAGGAPRRRRRAAARAGEPGGRVGRGGEGRLPAAGQQEGPRLAAQEARKAPRRPEQPGSHATRSTPRQTPSGETGTELVDGVGWRASNWSITSA